MLDTVRKPKEEVFFRKVGASIKISKHIDRGILRPARTSFPGGINNEDNEKGIAIRMFRDGVKDDIYVFLRDVKLPDIVSGI